jgi:O-antigen ligase
MQIAARAMGNQAAAPAPPSRAGIPGDGLFRLLWALIIGAIALGAFGNVMFGLTLPNGISAYFVYGAFFIQIVFLKLRLPIRLMWLFGLVFFQTFVVNLSPESFTASIVQLAGLVLFSVTAFSFVSTYRTRMVELVRMYYVFSFLVSCFAAVQTTVFLVFGKGLYIQDLLGGPEVTNGRLAPEILGFVPRATSIASEPANLAMLLLPAVYLAVLVLVGRAGPLRLRSRLMAAVVILGLVLSFSLLGYISLAVVLLAILLTGAGKRRAIALVSGLGFIGAIGYAAAQLPLFQAKLATFLISPLEIGEYEFTGSDLSGFALISNALVAKSALSDSHLLGTGLKTHENNYDRYMSSYFSSSQVLMELNKTDAGSLYIRIASEFGIPGLLAIAWFLVKYKLKTGGETYPYRAINDMCFIYLVMYGTRSGNYLETSLWLFAALYYYSFVLERKRRSHGVTPVAQLTNPR